MAEELVLRPDDVKVKLRQPLGVLGLGIITLGIYNWFWWYYINREMADLGKSRGKTELGESPATSVLAITVGGLVLVPAIVSFVRTARRAQRTQKELGVDPFSGWLFAAIVIFTLGIAGYPYLQSQLNKAWRQTSGVPAVSSGPSADEIAAPVGETRIHQGP